MPDKLLANPFTLSTDNQPHKAGVSTLHGRTPEALQAGVGNTGVPIPILNLDGGI